MGLRTLIFITIIFLAGFAGSKLYNKLSITFFPQSEAQGKRAKSKKNSGVKQSVKTPAVKATTNLDVKSSPKLPPPPAPLPPEAPTGQELTAQGVRPNEIDPNLKFSNDDFAYDPTGRRDPFNSFIKIEKPKDAAPIVTQAGPAVPPWLQQPYGQNVEGTIEGFDTGQFKLVGIIWDVNDPKAMVRAPNNKVFMIRKRSKIGRSNGYVAAIREGEVVVIEVSGETKLPSTRVLVLQK